LDQIEHQLYNEIDIFNERAIKKLKILDETLLQQCESSRNNDKINTVESLIKKYKLNKIKQIFSKKTDLSSYEITRGIIGYLNGPKYSFECDSLKNANFSILLVDLSEELKSICGITEISMNKSNCGTLLVTDFASNSLVYIEQYDLPFTKPQIEIVKPKNLNNNLRLNLRNISKHYYAIVSDFDDISSNNNVYACDMELNRIVIFDSDSFEIKKIITNTPNRPEFYCLRDICYSNQIVYCLDQGYFSKHPIRLRTAYTVDTFDRNGNFLKTFELNNRINDETDLKYIHNPWSVKVNGSVMAIIDWKQKVFICNLQADVLCFVEQSEAISMCFVNDKQLFVHSESGQFIGYCLANISDNKMPIIFKKESKLLENGSEFIIFTNDRKFILSLGWKKSILVIDIH
jgi:hypothetical protein